MIFKKLSINEVGSFQPNQEKLLALIVKKNYEQSEGPMRDVEEKVNAAMVTGRKLRYLKRDKHYIVRDLITCLAVCHNVTPSMEGGQKVYQASSPD
jgi:phospholipid-translocating ATPase